MPVAMVASRFNLILYCLQYDWIQFQNINIVNYNTSQMHLQYTIWLHNHSNDNIFKSLLWHLEFTIMIATNQYLESP
jgi:hypothetical protein